MNQTENLNTTVMGSSDDGEAFLHPSFIKRAAARTYNRTGGAFLLHFLILNAVQMIVLISMGYNQLIGDMAAGNDVDEKRLSLILIIATAVSYVIANILSAVIGLSFSHRLKGSSDMFQRSKLGASVIIPAMFVTLGIQAVCLILQSLYIGITGDQGMSDTTAQLLSFGNGVETDVTLFIYMVFLGPVTEEIIFRGMALKNFSAVNRRFAIIISSVCFGIFHGNVLQFIVGFTLGMFFSYIDIKANSIMPSIILHIFNNLASAMMSIIFMNSEFTDFGEETAVIAQLIYIAAAIVLGIVGFILIKGKIFKREEKTAENDSSEHEVYPEFLAAEGQEIKGTTWKAAAKSPCLWIFAAIYIVVPIISSLFMNLLSSLSANA